ncbi:MAG: DUF2807 domain-containing protein [Clostridium sp.]|nr:DUF2807 domain-containing protein [Clostridium sp.]
MSNSFTRFLIIPLFCLLTLGLPALSHAAVHEYTSNVGQFDRLYIQDNVNVVYRCNPDSTGFLAYYGEKEFDNAFIFSNSKGKLKIQVNTEDVGKPDLPVIHVYSDFLTYVENSGQFTIKVFSPAPSPKFQAKIIGNGSIFVENLRSTDVSASITAGNGKIYLSGMAHTAKYRITGTGSIIADRLQCDEVKCTLSLGTGYIGLWAKDLLKVSGLGSTKIYYKGDPQIKKSGNAKIFPLPSNPTQISNPKEEQEVRQLEDEDIIVADDEDDDEDDELNAEESDPDDEDIDDKEEEEEEPEEEEAEEEATPIIAGELI